MKIEILSRPAEEAVFERDGVSRTYFKQWAVMTIDGLPTAFEFSNDTPLPPGPAELDPKSFSVMGGRLQVQRAKLNPLKAQPQQSAKQPA